jgi:predicted nuclease of restriction endonuclease-like (RecB) superfamily
MVKMKFVQLIAIIEEINKSLQIRACSSVNQLLVYRNWLIGFYLLEYEQKGEDRAQYGEKLLETIALELKKKKLKGFSFTNLKLFRQFYSVYPQIGQALPDQLLNEIIQALPVQFKFKKSQSLPDFSITDKEINTPLKLLMRLSFTHFTDLIKIKDPIKRAFYEQQAIEGNWSSRQLKRQIESLLIERIGLSKNKKALLDSVKGESSAMYVEETIKDPYILEFTGFKELPSYSESDLETALLNKIQDFLLELGNGFCFEARQKRITIGNEHDRIDLVFYHRILKCHVLVELKVRAFSYADVGQMNFYLNYFKKNIMGAGDNPPVGIILCTHKEEIKVEYANAGLDNQLFVSKYLVELPGKEELVKIIKNHVKERKWKSIDKKGLRP